MCEFEGALRASSRIDNESLHSSDGPEPREPGLALFLEDLMLEILKRAQD